MSAGQTLAMFFLLTVATLCIAYAALSSSPDTLTDAVVALDRKCRLIGCGTFAIAAAIVLELADQLMRGTSKPT